MDDIWATAKSKSTQDLMCYINSDIILFPDFVAKVRTVKYQEFLLAGRRWDLAVESLINFSSNWVSKLKGEVQERGILHRETGVDYFVFPKSNMPNMPAFAIGRGWWDNWLIYYFKNSNIPIIDGTEIMTVHQNHDYSHVKSSNKNTTSKGEELLQNKRIASMRYSDILYISDATYYWEGDEVFRVPLAQRISRVYYRFIRPKLQQLKHFFTSKEARSE